MEYESNILKRLVEKYGVIGNPSYDSEIIKQFITQGQKDFPQLFTYQADWLEHIDRFGLSSGEYTMTYTGQYVYIPTTKGKPIKRAILKGQTLVNLFDINSISNVPNGSGNQNINDWVVFKNNGGTNSQTYYYNTIRQDIEIGKKYIAFLYVGENTIGEVSVVGAHSGYHLYPMSFNVSSPGVYKTTFIAKTTATDRKGNMNFRCITSSSNVGEFKFRILLLKDEDVIGNQDFTYFEGMKSVRMPVLTTSNEDGTKTNILTVNEDVTLRSNGSVCDELDLLTGKLTQRIDEDGEVLTQEVVKTVDLTIVDQDNQTVNKLSTFEGGTHISSGSDTLKPVFVAEVIEDLEKRILECSSTGNTM